MAESEYREADIVINGVRLTPAQSMTLRVAVASFAGGLTNSRRLARLGKIGPLYRERIAEVEDIIVDPLLRTRKAGG